MTGITAFGANDPDVLRRYPQAVHDLKELRHFPSAVSTPGTHEHIYLFIRPGIFKQGGMGSIAMINGIKPVFKR
jgi:hypothetical protein